MCDNVQRLVFGITSFLLLSLLASPAAFGFDSAKTLPKGVRSVNVRTVQTDLSEKTNSAGTKEPLAQPLMETLTFAKVIKGEEVLKANKVRAFLLSNGFDENESLGEYTADLNGHVSVVAPIISYGLSDKFTMAIAVPIYQAQTSIQLGFKANDRAQAFVTALADPKNNLDADAREAAGKLNNAVGELNSKLTKHGYDELEDWEGKGIGDITVAGKYRFVDRTYLGVATTNGVVLPTGRRDDPDVLNDIAFGDGQWDLFTQLSVDEPVLGAESVTFNQNVKYTMQQPGRREIREVTADEKIDVERSDVTFKLGDKIDAGASVQWQPSFGLVSGLGYTYFKKYGDSYAGLAPETRTEVEEDTDQVAHASEAMLGYSTIPAFQRRSFPVPLELKLTYSKQLASRNMPVSDLAQLDFSVFF